MAMDHDGTSSITYLPNTAFINIYIINKAYGGPEEGGWWFDYGAVVSSEQVMADIIESKKLEKQLECDERNVGRYKPSSVLCTGWYVVRVEDEPGQDFPKERPHYE